MKPGWTANCVIVGPTRKPMTVAMMPNSARGLFNHPGCLIDRPFVGTRILIGEQNIERRQTLIPFTRSCGLFILLLRHAQGFPKLGRQRFGFFTWRLFFFLFDYRRFFLDLGAGAISTGGFSPASFVNPRSSNIHIFSPLINARSQGINIRSVPTLSCKLPEQRHHAPTDPASICPRLGSHQRIAAHGTQ